MVICLSEEAQQPTYHSRRGVATTGDPANSVQKVNFRGWGGEQANKGMKNGRIFVASGKA